MAKKNITIVTGLFNIGRGEMDTDFKRPFDHYIACFERMLKIDYPMVIYIEPENEHIVWKHRSASNTRVITKTLDDLRAFPFYSQVQKIRTDPKWYNQAGWLAGSTQAKLELYNPLVMSKVFFVNDASIFNFFDTKYFVWLDAGISNTIGDPVNYIDNDFEKRITPLLNKMLFIAFPYDKSTNEVHGFERGGMNSYAGKPTEYVCRGGFFGGNKDSINSFNEQYYHLLNDTLHNGYMGTEESIFTLFSYREPQKCNIHMIEPNGLIYKFFEDLKTMPLKKEVTHPLAFYVLTYNTPKQFKIWVDAFIKAYPEEFKNTKKYVVDNSNDEKAKKEYRKLFKEYDFEIIHEGTNLGIQDGRQKVAEHFHDSDHDYYIFFEEDMNMVSKDEPQNKKGFIRYIPKLFEKSIQILEDQQFDYLKLTIIEFYGDCTQDWAFKNVPEEKRKIYYPVREDGNEELRWKTKIHYLGFHKDVAYAAGFFHVDNWPHLISKKGNYQMYLYDPYEHKFEQTIMSQCRTYMEEGKLRGGCLLASPIEHSRIHFYDGKTRRENKHYKN